MKRWAGLFVIPGVVVIVAGGLLLSLRPRPPVAGAEITLQIRQYPDDGIPWNRGAAILVRVDVDRLRAYGFSSDDVMKAFGESSVVDSTPRVNPPPGVVFVTRLARPERYEQLIVRANADGEIVRLNDIGKVELLVDGEAPEAEPHTDRPRYRR